MRPLDAVQSLVHTAACSGRSVLRWKVCQRAVYSSRWSEALFRILISKRAHTGAFGVARVRFIGLAARRAGPPSLSGVILARSGGHWQADEARSLHFTECGWLALLSQQQQLAQMRCHADRLIRTRCRVSSTTAVPVPAPPSATGRPVHWSLTWPHSSPSMLLAVRWLSTAPTPSHIVVHLCSGRLEQTFVTALNWGH